MRKTGAAFNIGFEEDYRMRKTGAAFNTGFEWRGLVLRIFAAPAIFRSAHLSVL